MLLFFLVAIVGVVVFAYVAAVFAVMADGAVVAAVIVAAAVAALVSVVFAGVDVYSHACFFNDIDDTDAVVVVGDGNVPTVFFSADTVTADNADAVFDDVDDVDTVGVA